MRRPNSTPWPTKRHSICSSNPTINTIPPLTRETRGDGCPCWHQVPARKATLLALPPSPAGHCEPPCGGPPPHPTVDQNEGGLQPKAHGTEALNLTTTPEWAGVSTIWLTTALRGSRGEDHTNPHPNSWPQTPWGNGRWRVTHVQLSHLSRQHLPYRITWRRMCKGAHSTRTATQTPPENLTMDPKLVTYSVHTTKRYRNELQISMFNFVPFCKIKQTYPRTFSVYRLL